MTPKPTPLAFMPASTTRQSGGPLRTRSWCIGRAPSLRPFLEPSTRTSLQETLRRGQGCPGYQSQGGKLREGGQSYPINQKRAQNLRNRSRRDRCLLLPLAGVGGRDGRHKFLAQNPLKKEVKGREEERDRQDKQETESKQETIRPQMVGSRVPTCWS